MTLQVVIPSVFSADNYIDVAVVFLLPLVFLFHHFDFVRKPFDLWRLRRLTVSSTTEDPLFRWILPETKYYLYAEN